MLPNQRNFPDNITQYLQEARYSIIAPEEAPVAGEMCLTHLDFLTKYGDKFYLGACYYDEQIIAQYIKNGTAVRSSGALTAEQSEDIDDEMSDQTDLNQIAWPKILATRVDNGVVIDLTSLDWSDIQRLRNFENWQLEEEDFYDEFDDFWPSPQQVKKRENEFIRDAYLPVVLMLFPPLINVPEVDPETVKAVNREQAQCNLQWYLHYESLYGREYTFASDEVTEQIKRKLARRQKSAIIAAALASVGSSDQKC
jgi:hypothetical protein